MTTDRLDDLRRRRADHAADDTCAAVRDLVVVVSSSRGGSSMVGEVLRHAPATLHVPAEVNPHFVIAGDRDDVLRAELGNDIGVPATEVDSDRYELDVLWRLAIQWPGVDFDEERVRHHVRTAGADPVALLQRVVADHPAVDPWYYDLPDDVVARAFPGRPEPAGPPGDTIVEMPPFVLPRPWRAPTADELATQPVVLTTPRNAFRLDRLARIFPNARMRLVHLVRDPAAVVNGLVEGWHHRGFFTTAVDTDLDIAGWSDTVPWGRRWWCFDQPPEWRALASTPLADVCAAQWRAPHEAVMRFVDDNPGIDVHRVRFEDIVGDRRTRQRAFLDLAAWLGLHEGAPTALADAASSMRPVMATAPPDPERWRRRADELRPALSSPDVVGLAAALGYELPPEPRTVRHRRVSHAPRFGASKAAKAETARASVQRSAP